jgi:H+/Cl- antiporter ClcA
MKRRFAEQTVIFISVLKWVALATIIGAIVGASTAFFLKILQWSTSLAGKFPFYFLSLPVALFLSAVLVKHLAPDAQGHGTEKVIEAVHKYSGKIKAAVVPVKLVATVITIAAGGSVGKEGPCAQIGAGLASTFADLLKFNQQDRKKLVICGISAGFTAVFGTPIAGAIFGVEVLFVGSLLYDVLLPSFIAGMTGYQVAHGLGITYFHHPLKFVPVFSEAFFLKVVLAGIFFGLCAFMLIEMLKWSEKISAKLRIWAPLKGALGGVLLIILALVVSAQYLGLGLNLIEASLRGESIIWYAFLMKMLFTSITLSFGGSGGIVTPIFFIGATAGSVSAQILGLDLATFSAIGMVSLLAGAANAPIAASILSVELFGPAIAPYAAVACVISFLMTGHRSVYPSQILAVKKSASIQVELGKEMDEVTAEIRPRRKTLARGIWAASRTVQRKLKNRPKEDPDEHHH